MNNRNLTPIFLAVSIVLGILIGTFYASHFMGNRLNIINTGTNKLNYLLQLVDNNYVDTVDMNQMVEDAMPLILSELDPHSAYIPAKDAEAETQDLKGSFSGVGITFSMVNDTVNVMSIIAGCLLIVYGVAELISAFRMEKARAEFEIRRTEYSVNPNARTTTPSSLEDAKEVNYEKIEDPEIQEDMD